MIKSNKLIGYLVITVVMLVSISACQPAELAVDPADLTPPPTEVPEAEDVLSAVFPPEDSNEQPVINLEGATVTESGLQFIESNPSDGPKPQVGDIVSMNFIATL